MVAAATTILRGSWRSKTASELREIGDKSLILSPILVFEHELSRIYTNMAKKDKDEMAAQGMPQTMEDYLLSQLEEQVVLKV